MATIHNIESETIFGTISGTVLTVMVNIGSSDILKTIVLAIVGAVVSFFTTLFLKWMLRKYKN
jgi:uncharacterized membrane protein YeaQ/YmgE (transglycosylase-associated protein family)